MNECAYNFCGSCGCVQLHRRVENCDYFQCIGCGARASRKEVEKFVEEHMKLEELDKSYDSDKED